MDLEWDPRKAAANLRTHGIDFADAATALQDESAITVLDDSSGEDRFATIGADALGRLVVVVFTWRRQRVRLNLGAARDRKGAQPL